MESVEELCDNITLIHKAKTILEGRVDEIRKSWAGNEYDVVFENKVDIKDNNHYSIISQKNENGKSELILKTRDDIATNDILQIMMKSGKIISFNPALPSMNEIFIRVVRSKNIEIEN
jgi:ABC-2 type transport system ATP-binding protein